MEKKIKVFELQSYIRENFIKDLILIIARYMVGSLTKVRKFEIFKLIRKDFDKSEITG